MKKNQIKQLWNVGRPALNGWLSIANSFSAELMAEQGYDAITIDLQHGVVDYQGMVGMLQALRASGVMPLTRVPWLEPGAIMKALDAGAYGVICPMINNRAQAAEFVSCLKYPPHGNRSFGPTRANISAGAGYRDEADEEIIGFAMIETAQAFEHLEEIVTTPGLTGVYIGPADLTLGLTGNRFAPGFDREEPEMIEAIKTILHAAHRAGIRAALHCGSASYAARAIGWGFDLVTISNDVRLLASAASESVKETRRLLGEAAAASPSVYTQTNTY